MGEAQRGSARPPDPQVAQKSTRDGRVFLGELHKSAREIPISPREIHKSLKEIPISPKNLHISLKEIPISLADLYISTLDSRTPKPRFTRKSIRLYGSRLVRGVTSLDFARANLLSHRAARGGRSKNPARRGNRGRAGFGVVRGFRCLRRQRAFRGRRPD